MKYFFKHNTKLSLKPKGFVLPFTLLITGIMLLISISISTIITKQIYFSNVARGSQVAYYAADNALACTLAIEETYSVGGTGFFPFDSAITTTMLHLTNMQDKLDIINEGRAVQIPALFPLAPEVTDIRCAQSVIFNTSTSSSHFTVEETDFEYDTGGGVMESGQTSSFNMKMQIANNDYRCAKVTINKTPTFKQIISQGYSRCDAPTGSIERAVVYSTVQ